MSAGTPVIAPSVRQGSLATVEACLERIEARAPAVGAWAHVDADGAREQACAADEVAPRSALHGVPVGFKDIIETADLPTAYGSVIWEGHRPTADAACVRQLRHAGAVILGKTTTTEFATYEPTQTRNPHHPEHTPGGSSSGSAAAVGDGQVPLALGTQTAGSVNRPGSFCGVFTHKATYRRWSFDGVLPVALTFDTLGGFARDPALLGALDDVLSVNESGSAPVDHALPRLSQLRVGVVKGPWWGQAEPEAADLLDNAVDRLQSLVASVGQVDVDPALADLSTAHALIQNHEAAYYLRPRIEPAPERISNLLREHLTEGTHASADRVQRSRELLRHARRFVGDALGTFDVLMTLAAPGEAPGNLGTGDPVFNRLASTAGVPAVGFPAGRGSHGLPLGIQFMGPHASDRHLIGLVEGLYRETDLVALPALPH